MNVNKVIVIGRLGKDPEVKTLPSGSFLATFSLAVSESWVGKDGQKQERTEWIRVKVFGNTAENCGKYLRRGDQCYVEGSLQTSQWENAEGQKQFSTDVVARVVLFGEKRKSSNAPKDVAKAVTKPMDLGPEPSFDSTDEIPF